MEPELMTELSLPLCGVPLLLVCLAALRVPPSAATPMTRRICPGHPEPPAPTEVGGLKITGDEPTCGFVCCPPQGKHVADKDVPAAFADLYSQVSGI
jgi:hypothetical protein